MDGFCLLRGNTKKQRNTCKKQQDWDKWHIYHGDERCLPVDDAERNSLVADQKWLDLVSIPKLEVGEYCPLVKP